MKSSYMFCINENCCFFERNSIVIIFIGGVTIFKLLYTYIVLESFILSNNLNIFILRF